MSFWLTRIWIFIVPVWLTACGTPFVGLWEAEKNRVIDDDISADQVRGAILEGARNAGWSVLDTSEYAVQVRKKIRVHTVTLNIQYSSNQYFPRYASSIGMKIQCTSSEINNRKHRVSGLEDCEGDRPPYTIHKNYRVWLDELAAEIDKALASGN